MNGSRTPSHRHQLLLLLGFSLLGLLLVYQIPVTQRVDLGSPQDGPYIKGFYFPELQDGATVRWSGPTAEVVFPGAGIRAWRLHLRLSGLRPVGPVHVNVTANGRRLAGFDAGGEMAEYMVDLPPASRALGNVEVQLSTQPFTSPPDERKLGVMVDWVRLEPASFGLVLPAWAMLAGLLVCIAAVYGTTLRLGGRSPWPLRAGIAAAVLAGVALLVARPWLGANLALFVILSILAWLVSEWLRGAAWWEWLLILPLAWSTYRFVERALEFYRTGLPPGDFTIYYNAAHNLRIGQPLYDFAAAQGMPNGPVYKYPPLFAVLLAPVTVEPAGPVAAGWYVLNLGLLALSFWLIMRNLAGTQLPAGALMIGAIALLNFQPAWESLIRGQMDVLILTCAVVALVLLEGRRAEPAAGALIAFAAMLKLYPGVLCLYLLWRRRWSALAGFAVAFGLLIILSGVTAGWGNVWRYVTDVLTVQTAAVPYPENQSIDGFLSRLVIPGNATTWYTTIPFPGFTLFVLYVLDLVTLALTFLLSWRVPESRPGAFRFGYAAAMPLIVLLWPTAWIHYQTLLLLPFALVFTWAWRAGPRIWPAWLALLACFLLVAVGNEYLVLIPRLQEGWPRLLQSYKLYGVLILWLLVIYAGRHPATEAARARARQAGQPAGGAIPTLS